MQAPARQPPATPALPATPLPVIPQTAKDLEAALAAQGYLADPKLALVVWLAVQLKRPVLLEGPAGVGKTDLARAVAQALGRPLVRLQCYEGLDEGKALYEWDYGKQMLYTQLLRDAVAKEAAGAGSLKDAAERLTGVDATFFGPRFLIARPILQALTSDVPVVLLLDEVDRSDPEFEAFLLEVLAEEQVTIPEIGTIKAKHSPIVLLTSNASRDMTDALRRRCLHAFLEYPPPSRELAILELRVPGLSASLAAQLSDIAHKIRAMDLRKHPSIAETIDWARALLALGASAIDAETARATLGVILKYEEDRAKVLPQVDALVGAKK